MHPRQPRHLDNSLDIPRHRVPCVLPPPTLHLEQLINLPVIHRDGIPGQLRQPFVGVVARLVGYGFVEVVDLVVEKRAGKVPELGRVEALHGERGLVHEGRGRVPRLDLLADYELDFGGEGGVDADAGDGGVYEGVEEFWLGLWLVWSCNLE